MSAVPVPLRPRQVRGPFLVMSITNTFVHVYPSVATMLADHHPVAVEAFDRDRFRVVFSFCEHGALTGAWRTGEQVDEDQLLRRIDAVATHLEARVNARLAAPAAKVADATVEEDLEELAERSPATFANLRTGKYEERFDVISAPPFGHSDPDDPNKGDAFHQCVAHLDCWA